MHFTLFLLAAVAASATASPQGKRACRRYYPQPVRDGGFEAGNSTTDVIHDWHIQTIGPDADVVNVARRRVGFGADGIELGPHLYSPEGDYVLAIYNNGYNSTTAATAVTVSQTVCLAAVSHHYHPSFVFGYHYDTNYPTSDFTSVPSFTVQLGNMTLYQSNICGNQSATLSSTELCNTTGWQASVVRLPRIRVPFYGADNLTLTWDFNGSGPRITGFLDNISLRIVS